MITTALQLSLSQRLCPPTIPTRPVLARGHTVHRQSEVTLSNPATALFWLGAVLGSSSQTHLQPQFSWYHTIHPQPRVWAVHTYCAPRGTLLWCLQQMKEHIVTSSSVFRVSPPGTIQRHLSGFSFFIFKLFTLILYGDERSWRHTEPCFIFLLNFRTLIKMQINSM